MLEAGISSTHLIGRFWSIVPDQAEGSRSRASAPPRRAEPRPKPAEATWSRQAGSPENHRGRASKRWADEVIPDHTANVRNGSKADIRRPSTQRQFGSPNCLARQAIISLGHLEQMPSHILVGQTHCQIAAVFSLLAKVAGHRAGGAQRPAPTTQFSNAALMSGGRPLAAATKFRRYSSSSGSSAGSNTIPHSPLSDHTTVPNA